MLDAKLTVLVVLDPPTRRAGAAVRATSSTTTISTINAASLRFTVIASPRTSPISAFTRSSTAGRSRPESSRATASSSTPIARWASFKTRSPRISSRSCPAGWRSATFATPPPAARISATRSRSRSTTQRARSRSATTATSRTQTSSAPSSRRAARSSRATPTPRCSCTSSPRARRSPSRTASPTR